MTSSLTTMNGAITVEKMGKMGGEGATVFGCWKAKRNRRRGGVSCPVATVDEEQGVRLRQTRLAASPRGIRLKTLLDILFDAPLVFWMSFFVSTLAFRPGPWTGLQCHHFTSGPDVTLPSHRNIACTQAIACHVMHLLLLDPKVCW
jgi:hypothetical protein